MSKYNLMYKIIIIGDSCCGKTSIVEQFINKNFIYNQPLTIGVEFSVGHIELPDNNLARLQIWDTAGQESFRSITKSYYRNAIGAIITFDLTKKRTFNNLEYWINELKNNGNDHVQLLIVGNKSDLKGKRAISHEEILKFTEKHDLIYNEVSAKDYDSCCNVFNTIAHNIFESLNNKTDDELQKINGLKIIENKSVKSRRGCLNNLEQEDICCTIL